MKFKRNYRVLAGQVDTTNHLSNVQYYEFFKSCAFAFLYDINFTALNEPNDLWPIVFNESCEFYHEVLFDQEISVELHFTDLSEKKNKYLCHGLMYDMNGNKMAYWKSSHGALDRKTRKIVPMSDAAFAVFQQYCG